MSLQPSEASKPLPSVPCAVFDSHRVKWDAWSPAVPVTHIDPSCSACSFPGPLFTASAALLPNPGEMFDGVREKKGRSGRDYAVPQRYPAHPVLRLWAVLCPTCYAIEVIDPAGLDENRNSVDVPAILCDGCDRYCAAGATLAEARSNLVAVGGWSAAETDWDLCPACNPASPEPTSIRAATAIRASRRSAR